MIAIGFNFISNFELINPIIALLSLCVCVPLVSLSPYSPHKSSAPGVMLRGVPLFRPARCCVCGKTATSALTLYH